MKYNTKHRFTIAAGWQSRWLDSLYSSSDRWLMFCKWSP